MSYMGQRAYCEMPRQHGYKVQLVNEVLLIDRMYIFNQGCIISNGIEKSLNINWNGHELLLIM